MPALPKLPRPVLDRFRSVYEALEATRSWYQGSAGLRFAALSAVGCDGAPATIASAIRARAEEIRGRTGVFDHRRSELRHVVAALLMRHGDTPAAFLDEHDRVSAFFRAEKLRRGGGYESAAVLILRILAERRPLRREDIARLRAIHDEMKRYHWWLTGPDDYPACAILTALPDEATAIGARTEEMYRALAGAGFSNGNPLQLAANLLALTSLSAEGAATRAAALAERFRAAGVKIWQTDYDELAVLAFLDGKADDVAGRVLAYRREVEDLRPNPGRVGTFNLGASLAFLDLAPSSGGLGLLSEAKTLLDLQGILVSQQAAAGAASASAAASG